MKAALLDRGILKVSGPDAQRFLQGLVTADIEDVMREGVGYGALLTPQGKILFDFLVYAQDGAILLDAPRALTSDLGKRLAFYRLRAKVEIADEGDVRAVAAVWDTPVAPTPGAGTSAEVRRDPRHPGLGYRVVLPAAQAPASLEAAGAELRSAADWHRHRIALTVPEGGVDFEYGSAFPHDAAMDDLTGLDFAKGCYVGQEVVSRMEHRGTARRRLVRVEADAPLPQTGTEITAAGRPVGRLGSVDGAIGIALVRLDRAGEAIAAGVTIEAAGTPVHLSIPDWADYDFPAVAAEGGD